MTPGIAYIKNCISHNSWDYVSDRECAYANGCAHELTVSHVFLCRALQSPDLSTCRTGGRGVAGWCT